MTEKIQESMARATAYSSTLLATDPRFHQAAQVLHIDGSLFRISCAFLMLDPESTRWLWLITEHFGEFVFDNSDVESAEEHPDLGSLPAW